MKTTDTPENECLTPGEGFDAAATALALEISVVKFGQNEDWERLREDWNALADAHPDLTLFQRQEWIENWWKVVAKPGQEMILLAAYLDQRLVGLAPLRLQHRVLWGIRVRQMNFMADDISDYCQILAAEGLETPVHQAFWNYFKDHSEAWDILVLREIPQKAFDEIKKTQDTCLNRPCLLLWGNKTFYLPLPGTWETYSRGVNRRMMRKYERQLSLLKNCRLEIYSGETITPEVVEQIVQLNQYIPLPKRLGSIFLTEPYRRFHVEQVLRGPLREALHLLILYVGSKPAAYQYLFYYKNKLSVYNCSFDELFSRMSLGTYNDLTNIETGFRKNYAAVDFMRGDYEYKKSYGCEERRNHQFLVFRNDKIKLAYLLWEKGHDWLLQVYKRTFLPMKITLRFGFRCLRGCWRSMLRDGTKSFWLKAWPIVKKKFYLSDSCYFIRAVLKEAGSGEAVPLPEGVLVRELFLSDYDLLENYFSRENMARIIAQFWNGDRLWGAILQNRLAGYIWVAKTDNVEEEIEITIKVNHDEMYLFDGFVDPAFRGKNLMFHMIRNLIKDDKIKRMRYLTSLTKTHNAVMLKILNRLHFKIETRITRWKLGFVKLRFDKKMNGKA